MSKVRDLVTSTKKDIPHTRKGGKHSFMSFRRAGEEEIKLAQEEKHERELAKIAQEASLLRAVEEEQKRVETEQNRIARNNFINKKMSNAFGTKTKIDSSPTRQLAVDNILPKAFIPEQAYPEPFEEEPLLNKELADFKKKINEHLHKMGFAGSGGGGIGDIADAGDIDSGTAKVDGKYLKYQSSTGKWIGATALTGALTDLDIDGGTDIGAAIVDADLFIIDDGAGGTNRKTAASRLKTYIGAGAADDLAAGDAAVTLTTSSGNITIDAAANNSDIIFKGTDATADITMLTLDGSEAGAATFNDKIVATELDISGDVDVDGTLEADAYTVDGTTLAEYIADTTGAMVGSNTETGITVTYQDADNTIDFAVDAAQTAITSIYNTSLAIGYGSSHANIDFGTDNRIVFDIDGTSQVLVLDGVFRPTTDSDVDLGASAKYWKDAYIDTILTTGAITSGGILKTDDATEATNTTDGSLQTDGGLSVVKDVVAGDDVKLLSDAAVLSFGTNSDVTLTHVHDTGILLNSTMAIQFNDASQYINAPSNAILDINATDEIELNATLADVNANLDVSGTYTGGGLMTTGGNIVIPDDGTIGSATDADAIAIASTGVVTFSQNTVAATDTDTSNTGSITLDFAGSQNFVLTFTGNVTLANPSTEVVGQAGIIICIQDGTGSRTLSLGTDYETAAGGGITLSTAANAVDVIPYFVKAAGSIQLGAVQKAFS